MKEEAVVANGPMDSDPCVYIELNEKQLKGLAKLKIDDMVEVTLRGSVKGISQRESYDGKKVQGSLDVEYSSVKITSTGEFEDLLDD